MAEFRNTVSTEAELRQAIGGLPNPLAVAKDIGVLDAHCRAYIAHSPFVLVATSGADGRCDVSPKGGPAGFVKVLDDRRVALPDLNGNNLIDSLVNIVANPHAALLLLIPGQGESPDVDRGIRAHGSSDYLSMYSANGYSHGCHRLPNHLAIRLYDFVLQHRNTIVHGDAPMDFARQFLYADHVYEMRIPSRGFEFELDPPMAVTVLEGTIKGTLKQPVEGAVPKPGVRYPPSVLPPDDEVDSVSNATQPARAAADKGAP